MLDALITYGLVALAAAYLVWRLVLPVRARTLIASRLKGEQAPCAPEPSGGCAVGCSGCALASTHDPKSARPKPRR